MSDTNDNLNQVAAEATTTSTVQAEGAEGSVSQNQETSQENLILGKFRNAEELAKAYQNLEKLASRKTVDPSALGLTQNQVKQAEQGQQVQANHSQRAEVRQEVQQASQGSALGQWYRQAVASGIPPEEAISMIADARAQQAAEVAMRKVLEPVTERQNTLVIRSVTEALAQEYEDFQDNAEAIGKYLEANPQIKAAIVSKDTDEDTKRYHLENAYLRVARGKAKNAESAAKVAGAVDAKQREQMKAATVTGGQGASSRNPVDGSGLADEWEKAAKAYEKGRRLFG